MARTLLPLSEILPAALELLERELDCFDKQEDRFSRQYRAEFSSERDGARPGAMLVPDILLQNIATHFIEFNTKHLLLSREVFSNEILGIPMLDLAAQLVALVKNERRHYPTKTVNLITADLLMPSGTDIAVRANHGGIAARLVRQYDISRDWFPARIDILYGFSVGCCRHCGC